MANCKYMFEAKVVRYVREIKQITRGSAMFIFPRATPLKEIHREIVAAIIVGRGPPGKNYPATFARNDGI